VERFGSYKLTDRERMRRYIKARCLYELKERAGARDAVESYLRHGVEVGEGLIGPHRGFPSQAGNMTGL
jgi:hypothetical protein